MKKLILYLIRYGLEKGFYTIGDLEYKGYTKEDYEKNNLEKKIDDEMVEDMLNNAGAIN